MSRKGDDDKGANVLNIIILVEGYFLEYVSRCVAKSLGGFWLRNGTQAGRLDDDTKKILC